VWFELVKDLVAPAISVPPNASKSVFASTLLSSYGGDGTTALSDAAQAAFPALAASIVPNLIISPPPTPFSVLLLPALAPYLIGATEPIGPATAVASALGAWLVSAIWTVPPAPAPVPLPFTVGP
jgi:hypothetical protein